MSEVEPIDPDSGYDLPPFGALIAGLADISEPEDGELDDLSTADIAELEEIKLSLAIELEVRDTDRDAPRVTGSTPTQWTETTVMPAFHRLTMRIAEGYDG